MKFREAVEKYVYADYYELFRMISVGHGLWFFSYCMDELDKAGVLCLVDDDNVSDIHYDHVRGFSYVGGVYCVRDGLAVALDSEIPPIYPPIKI